MKPKKERVRSKSEQKRLAVQRAERPKPKGRGVKTGPRLPVLSELAPEPKRLRKEPTKAAGIAKEAQMAGDTKHGEGEILKAKVVDAKTVSPIEEGEDLTNRITECLDTWGAKQNTMLIAALRVVTERDTGITNLALQNIAVELGIATKEEIEKVKETEATKGPDAGLKPGVEPQKSGRG